MRLFVLAFAATTLLHISAVNAATIDMDDPRRVVGREGDIRVDAQLIQDTVSPGTAVGVTYQIENFGTTPVAVADKVADATFDSDTRTITLAIGAEVPPDGKMPHVVTIAPGEKKIFRAGATPSLNAAAMRSALAASPRYVQVKVSILRNLAPFERLIAEQTRGPRQLTDAQFDQWFESNDTIFLNTVPVRYAPRAGSIAGAEHRDASSSF